MVSPLILLSLLLVFSAFAYIFEEMYNIEITTEMHTVFKSLPITIKQIIIIHLCLMLSDMKKHVGIGKKNGQFILEM